MKKINKTMISILLIFTMIFSYIAPIAPVLAAVNLTKYTYDYSEINAIPEEYSHGELVWTDETEIITITKPLQYDEKTISVGYKAGYLARANDSEIKFRITKCAHDEDGNLCDVICTVNNFSAFAETKTEQRSVWQTEIDQIKDDEGNPITDILRNGIWVSTDKDTNLIKINFSTYSSSAIFKMQYVKTGTTEKANINKAFATIGDLDVWGDPTVDTNEIWEGNEGISIGSTPGKIYYDEQSGWVITDKYDNEDKAVRVRTKTGDDDEEPIGVKDNNNELRKISSALVLEDLNDSTFELFYSGRNCGIYYTFASPLQYNVDVTASIDNGTTKINDGNENAQTTMPTKTVTNGDSSTNIVYFTPANGYKLSSVTVDGQSVALNSDRIVLNNGTYSYTFTDTNISRDIAHNVIITTEKKDATVTAIYVDEEDNQLADPVVNNNLKVGDAYTTTAKNISKYELTATPTNATGTATEEPITVKYIYTKKKSTVTAVYVDEEDNQLADPVVQENLVVDTEYTTQEAAISGYQLTTTPVNATGTVTEEPITVKYVYTKKPASVTINYLDEENNPIPGVTPETETGYVDDEYDTEPNRKEIPGYELIEEKLPTNEKGTMTEEPIIVNYIYKLKDAKVIVKHVNEDGKEIADSETLNKKYFETYDTSSKDIANYKLKTTPENASGTVNSDETTVTYVYELKAGTVNVIYVDENGKQLTDPEKITGKVTEDYTTKKKKISGYTLTKTPENATGKFTEEAITVIYRYSKNVVPELPKTGNTSMYIISIIAISTFAIVMAIGRRKYKGI